MGLTFDRHAEDHGGAGLEARKEWDECVWEVEGPRMLKCSINLTLGAIATGRQTHAVGILLHGTGHINGPDYPITGSPPGLGTSGLSWSSLAGKPALELGLCRHRSAASQESHWTQELLKLDVSRRKYNLGHRPTRGVRHRRQPPGHCCWGLNASREKRDQSGPRTNIFGQE